jgi:hypothetical protein
MSAEVLFNDGVAQMKAGKYAAACPKIEESQRLEPRPGTLFTLAECRAKEGKIATALARYEEYLRVFSRMPDAEKSKQRGRDKIAEAKRAELKPKVPQLKLALPPTAPSTTRVEKDGVELGRASLDTWLPVDPGEIVLVVTTPGGGRRETKATLSPGDRRELTLELPAASSASSEPDVTTSPGGPAPETPRAETKKNNTLAWVALGIGGAGLVASAVTGALALSKKGAIDDNCGIGGDDTACNAEGKDAADSAQTLALVSTVSFAVGVVGIGTGTVLLIGAGNDGAESHAAVTLSGHW